MKILFLSDNFPPEVNAAASRVYERACYWIQDNHNVSVITCAPNFPLGKIYEGYHNKWVQREEMNGIHVIRVKTFMAPNKGFMLRTLDFMSYMMMAIIVGIFQEKPDIIISTSPQFFTAVGGWILSKIKRVPFVFEIGDLWPESIKGLGLMSDSFIYKLLEKMELFLYRHSQFIVAQTPAFKENLISRGIHPHKITVILNGVDVNKFKPLTEKDQDIIKDYHLEGKFIVGYIGTHGMAHDLTKVIDVAKIVETLSPDIMFLFVGDGADKQNVVQYAQSCNVKNVLFLPLQPKSTIHRWWSICDLSLITLKDLDIFKTVIPSKIFEASGMGLPILLFAPEGEASKLVEEGKCGVHVSPQDMEQVTKEIMDLSLNGDRRKELSRAALKVANIYSRERQAKEFMNYIVGCEK
jgi:glycosyltransferase involved in cell wall biosynthesis